MIELKDFENVKKIVTKRGNDIIYILKEPVFVTIIKKVSKLNRSYYFESSKYAETKNKIAYVVRVYSECNEIWSILIRIPGWHYGHEGERDYGSKDNSQWYVAPDMIELCRRI